MTEIEQLRAELDEQCRLLGAGSEREARLMAQLAESQAREAKLRAELEWQRRHTYNPFEPDNQCNNHKRICAVLAIPADDTALKSRLKEERERIAKNFEKQAADYASEYGYDDMGALSFGSGVGGEIKMDYYNGLLEHAEEIRNMGDE